MGFAMDSLPSIRPCALLAVCRAVDAPLGWTAAGQSGSLGLECLAAFVPWPLSEVFSFGSRQRELNAVLYLPTSCREICRRLRGWDGRLCVLSVFKFFFFLPF